MHFTFHGLDGRAAATHAALSTGFALSISGRPAIVLRIAGPNDGVARLARTMPEGLSFVERTVSGGTLSLHDLDEMLGEVDPQACDVVLDLPLDLVVHPGLSALADLSILVVGPGALDERLAASALGRLPAESVGQPLWLLGCGRSGGGPAAGRFERSMRSLLGCEGGNPSPRHSFLPVTLPAPTRSEADALADGCPQPRTVRQGLLLLAAVEVAASNPNAADLDQDAFVEALGLGERTLVSADQRRLSERLRDLADDLERLEDGDPTPEELDEAPSMRGWTFQAGRTRVIAGYVFDHPTIPSGRAALTSDVYATDGKTWARTLSRLYRLQTPAIAMRQAGLQ
jgi:hypothetical protein